MEGNGPRIEKHGFNVEDDEHQGEHIVSDVKLNPCSSDGFVTGLVGGATGSTAAFGSNDFGHTQSQDGNEAADEQEA